MLWFKTNLIFFFFAEGVQLREIRLNVGIEIPPGGCSSLVFRIRQMFGGRIRRLVAAGFKMFNFIV